MEKINQLTVNGQSYLLSDPETAKGLSKEIADRQGADETVLQTAQNYTDTAVSQLSEYVDLGLNTVHNNTIKAVNLLGNRVSALEADFRHIDTYEHTTDQQIQQVDITRDSQGNEFACSEFLLLLTLPTSEEIYENHRTQLYIGQTASWSNWLLLFRQAFSRDTQRKWRIYLRHAFDGWWVGDGYMSEDTTDYAAKDVTSSCNIGNIKSLSQVGKTLSRLSFYTTAKIPTGTKIEVYGR